MFYLDLDYEKLTEEYDTWIPYAMHTSDCFAVMSYLSQPYTGGMAECRHSRFLTPLQPYFLRCKTGFSEWPGTKIDTTVPKEFQGWHFDVMLCYLACQEAADTLAKLSNLMVCESGKPEDLHFYRGDHAWLFTTTHEKMASLENPSEKDLQFFQRYSLP